MNGGDAASIGGMAGSGALMGSVAGPWGTAIGAAVGLGAGVVGYLVAKGHRDKAEEILKQAAARYGDISAPTLERVAAEVLGPSAYAQIQHDPVYQKAKLDALNRLGGVVQGGGYDVQARAAENQALNKAARQSYAQQGAVLDSMAARGVGGSGAEIGALLANAQANADRNAQVGLDTAAAAQKRYLDSILAQGQLGGQYAAQDWQEKARAADAYDTIARWNADSRQRANYYNAGLAQQDFNNRVGLADRKYKMAQDQANLESGHAAQVQQLWGGLGQAAQYAGSAVDSYRQGQRNYDNWLAGQPGAGGGGAGGGYASAPQELSGYAMHPTQDGADFDPNDPRNRRVT